MKKNMSKFLKKVKNIGDAFLNELPVNEDWYQERLKICSGCEYNSDNIPKESKTLVQKIRGVANVCPEVRWCTLCGCCIDRKAAVPGEICGIYSDKKMKEQGVKPKWMPISISNIDEKISVIKPDDESYILKREGDFFEINLGDCKGDVVEFNYEMIVPENFEIKSINAACGCTHPQVEKIDSGHFNFNVRISLKQLIKNTISSKTANIIFINSNKEEAVQFKFILKALNNV